ncbi:MAG: hypothetical protein HOM21_16980, partial [Halobacteriovoraceae bacterium]|nr:hypothetical protein [Halobacteriovoraceae bacterium]
MKTTLLVLTLIFGTASAFAKEGTITCHTPRMAKAFTIQDNSVTFYEDAP